MSNGTVHISTHWDCFPSALSSRQPRSIFGLYTCATPTHPQARLRVFFLLLASGTGSPFGYRYELGWRRLVWLWLLTWASGPPAHTASWFAFGSCSDLILMYQFLHVVTTAGHTWLCYLAGSIENGSQLTLLEVRWSLCVPWSSILPWPGPDVMPGTIFQYMYNSSLWTA
jgi:hypothetical protein